MPTPFWRWKKLDEMTRRFENRPFEYWNNPAPRPWITLEQQLNPLSVHQFMPELFPLIEDFEVIIWAVIDREEQREEDLIYYLHFWSPSRGFLGNPLRTSNGGSEIVPSFLCEDDFVIPCGSLANPYNDIDQGFAIHIAEQDDLVYIARGDFDELEKKGYDRLYLEVILGQITDQYIDLAYA